MYPTVQDQLLYSSSLYSRVQGIKSKGLLLDESWNLKIPLTINAGQVPSTQNNFPLLINDTYPDLIGEVEAELRFAGSDNIQLPYEIQKFDNTTGELIAWIKKPTVSDGDVLSIFFDNPEATDEQNPAAVWSDYGAVYHMNQTIFGVDSILDSTINDNKGSTVGAPSTIAGKIGDAYRTNSGGIVTIPTSPSVDIGGGSFTIEAWIETFGAADNFFGIIEKKLAFNGLNKGFQIHNDFRNPIAGLQVRLNNGVTSTNDRVFNNYNNSTAILQNNGLHHITSVFDSISRVVQSYVDGIPGTTSSYLDTPIDFTNALSLKFGDTNVPDMTLDEVRLSSVAKTADYVTTSFNNQSSPTTFYATGVTVRLDFWFDTDWKSRIPLVINAGQVPAPETDFPLLINDIYPDLIGAVEAELRFAGTDTIQLEYEIQKFDNTTGELIAWIKKPLVSSDDVIYIYFDNPAAIDEQNAAAVYDANYNIVCHLHSDANDSTGNAQNLTIFSSTSLGFVPGKVGDAYNFPGNNIVDYMIRNPVTPFPATFITLELWIKTTGTTDGIFSYAQGATPNRVLVFGQEALIIFINGDANIGTVSFNDGVYHKLDVTYTANTGFVIVYLDGVQVDTFFLSGGPLGGGSGSLVLGQDQDSVGGGFDPNQALDGDMQQMFLSDVLRSANYLKAKFNNQSNNSLFYSTLPLETI